MVSLLLQAFSVSTFVYLSDENNTYIGKLPLVLLSLALAIIIVKFRSKPMSLLEFKHYHTIYIIFIFIITCRYFATKAGEVF